MKRAILLALCAVFALSASAQCATSSITYTIPYDDSGDDDSELTYPATITEAIELANDPDEGNASEVIILLAEDYDISDNEAEAIQIVDGDIVKSVIIRGSGGKRTIRAAEDMRHFLMDASSSTTFTLDNVTLAPADDATGGGVLVVSGTFTANNVTFSGLNTTANDSSAIYDEDDYNGGAVSIVGSGIATFTGCTFTGNTGELGGAIYAVGTGGVTLSGTNTFTSNEASNGGAIYLAGAGVSTSSLMLGGVSTSGTVNAAQLVINNTASVTGFYQNSAGTNGGAIYVNTGGDAQLTGTVTFQGNKSASDGGAVYVYSTGKLTNAGAVTAFTDNHAGYNFSTSLPATNSANVSTYPDPTIDNTNPTLPASGFGGAICFNSTETSTLGDVTFDNNDAALGGAVYVMNVGSVNFNGASAVGTSSGNKAYLGGGLFMSTNGTVNFNANASFDYNTALDNGGALYTTQNGNENLKFNYPVSFSLNNANSDNGNLGNGGAVYWGMTSSAFASTFANGADFTNNSTSGTSPATINNDGGNGGAICIIDTSLFTVDGTSGYSFSGNTAFNKGGAIYTNTAPVTLSGITVTTRNSAEQGGFVYSASGTITVQNSSISNQQATAGGAVYGTAIVVNSSCDLSYNTSTGTSGISGGGAIYATTSLTASDATFTGNRANNFGGAVYAVSSTVSMNDVFFDSNLATGNGGAVYVANSSTVGAEYSTFANNNSTGGNGGAIYVDGTFTGYTNFFTGNAAGGNGGAIWFSQYGTGDGNFVIGSSMFNANVSTGGVGGAIWVQPDYAQIESCTFNANTVNGGTTARGGAVYIDTSMSASSRQVTGDINRCTFTRNEAGGGTSNSCGGALATRGKVSVTSCTFSLANKATNRGGAIYVGESGGISELTLYATIVVGNSLGTPNYGEDVWVENGSLISRNYNRIGYYGTGSGNQTWSGQTEDVQDNTWTAQSFFSGNSDLDDNEHSGSGRYTRVPPYIGSSRYVGLTQTIGNYQIESGQVILLSLMLSEDTALPVAQRATNQIPPTLRRTLPQYDERGVDVWALLTSPDIGAVMYEKIRSGGGSGSLSSLVISRVQMSGIPNTLKSVGTTASLIALVYYTNGRTAYAGDADGCEPVTWSSNPASIVEVEPTKGYIIAKAPGTATVTVTTYRDKDGGGKATDSRVVRVEAIPATFMNTVSEQYQSYFISYVDQIAEYDMSLALSDASASTVKAATFQRNFKSVWDVSSASQITDLRASTPTFSTPTTYTNTEGLKASKGAAVNINFPNRTGGDLFPLVYSWNFSGEEMKAALGYDLSGQTANAALAEKVFSALRIDYQTESGTWPVIGSDGVSAADAVQYGALKLAKADGDRGVHVELTAYLANVDASGDDDGPQFVKGSGSTRLLIVPDGDDDGVITGTMWMAQKVSSSSEPSGGDTTPTRPETDTPQSGGSSGGGGGCSALSMGIFGAVLLFGLKRR